MMHRTRSPAAPHRLRDLPRQEEGATILEFGLVAPILCVMLLGALDAGHTLYMQSVLQGAMQKAARDGTLEDSAGTTATKRDAIDAVVKEQLGTLHKTAMITITRRVYKTFTKAAAALHEDFAEPTGSFVDGFCNHNESFTDANNNGQFDRDGGDSVDHAGAKDNIVYTVSITYPRMFPIDKLIRGNGTTTLTATTVLANQPYGDQSSHGAPTNRQCGWGAVGQDAQPGT